ncbi:glycogen synthase isoform 1 [Sorochytrium milnesiophthora]
MPESSVSSRSVRRPWLFEVAWEVANKVGGIYTVLKTKAPVTVSEYHDHYVLIGPFSHKTAPMEVETVDPGSVSLDLRDAIHALDSQGIKSTFGRWLIEGAPYVLLFDVGSGYGRLSEWRGDLYKNCGIPSPQNDNEQNEAIVFGYIVAWFLGEFIYRHKTSAVIGHFHEWLAAVALPLIKKRGFNIATIFTTHATLLGRYLCAGSVDFYNNLRYFDCDAEAGKRGIYHRYCIERAAAHSADVFTTVSHITAFEAEHLLKRKPDGVLPNGLNVVKFSAVHEFQNLHAISKEKIHDFVRGHFYGHYDFDLENTLYFFISGRNEYRNKGADMFLESLARLNDRLKATGSNMTVVAFVIMPAPTHSFTVETLKGQAVVKQLRETVAEIQKNIGHRIFESCARGHTPQSAEVLTPEDIVLLKRRIFALRRDTLPPVVTHNMADDSENQILNQIRRLGLFNNRSDRVKVIYHPEFLNANNPLFGLDYDDFVRGCHLGVFPSYYEPWGYTPAECTVMGVPSITSNLSGFGCYMEEMIETPSDYGIYIVDRRLKAVDESIEQLADQMLSFCQKSRRQRINLRNRTERLSDILDWKRMGLEYVKARHLSLRRKYANAFHQDDDEAEIEADFHDGPVSKVPPPYSAPGSPRVRGVGEHGEEEEFTRDVSEKLNSLGFAQSHDEDEQHPIKIEFKNTAAQIIAGNTDI